MTEETKQRTEQKKEKTAFYPLSADPFHKGHLYNLKFALETGLFDKIYVGVGFNPAKKYLFSQDERVFLTKKSIESSGLDTQKIVVEPFLGLARNYCYRKGIGTIVRGSRNAEDFQYESDLADYHSKYGIKTFIEAPDRTNPTSSGFVKAIAIEAGMVHEYVHPAVKQALEERLRGISLIGVTGCMGSGKTTFCKDFVNYCAGKGIVVNHIDFDRLTQTLYSNEDELSKRVLTELEGYFGKGVFEKDVLNTRVLAGIVFGDREKRKKLAEILAIPSVMRLEDKLREMKGIVLVDAAYFTEYNMLPLVNNNMILVGCDEQERYVRIFKRNQITQKELEARVTSQHTHEEKRRIIQEAQKKDCHGFFYEVDNSGPAGSINYQQVLEKINESFPLLR